MKSEFEIFGYYITSDPEFMNKQNAITSQLENQLDELYDIAIKGKKSGIKKLHRLIKKNPRNPQLKNYLSVLYMKMGDIEKSKEVNHWIITEHPNYLFGKLNLAFEHYTNGKPEKMTEILGENIELKELYPQRDTFHIVEVIAMLKAAVFYYGAIGDIEQAEIRLDMMEELEPDSLDFEQASRQLMTDKMRVGMSLLTQKQEDIIKVEINRPKITNKTEPPKFNHPEINLLYTNDLTISDDDIQTILSLPRETLIKDLELILTDSIERYAYFEKKSDEDYRPEELNFVIHSTFFLAELEAKQSIHKILEVLSQGEEYINLYIGDFITEAFWEILLKLAKDDLNVLKEFMLKPGVYTYSKTEVARTLEQLAIHYPERKQEVVHFFEDVFNFYLNCKLEDNIIDSEMIGLVVASVIDFNGFELLPMIKKLYQKGYVFQGICGLYKDVEYAMTDRNVVNTRKEKILNLMDRYKHIINTWASYNDESIEKPLSYHQRGIDSFFEHNNGLPIIKDEKIGRNDPCPCGSGKKFKKCCLNK